MVAVGLLLAIEIGLRCSSLPTVCRLLGIGLALDGRAVPSDPPPVLPPWSRRPLRVAALVAVRWPAGDTCLRRCLLVGHRLRRLKPVLRIGVRRVSGEFSAHSWLEIGGRSLDGNVRDFAPLIRARR